MKTSHLILPFLLCTLFSCTEKAESNIDIDIESSLDNFRITPLSDYASEIRYVKLETNDSCLVTNDIQKMYLEDFKIFVHDDEPYLKVFDAITGKYLYNIGKKGNGPGELPYLSHVDIDAKRKRILLSWQDFIHQFDFAGNFLQRIEKADIGENEKISWNVVSTEEGLYAAGVRHYADHQEYAIALFDPNGLVNTVESHRDPAHHPIYKGWNSFVTSGIFYRTPSSLRFYRSICDTIYTYESRSKNFIPQFVLSFGKYQSTFDYNPGCENKALISIREICEDTKSIFLFLYTLKNSPEPFLEDVTRMNQTRTVTNNDILGIYDKEKKQLHFLLQPVPGIIGLKNDLDNGLPFRPRYVSSDNTLVSYYQAGYFLEKGEEILSSDETFKSVLRSIEIEDNPVVVIVKKNRI